MTEQEWESICFLIEEWWEPNRAEGEFDEHRRNAWLLALVGFTAEEVAQAVKALLIRGEKWRPKVSQVIAQITNDPSVPTFEEALELIRVCLGARTLVRKARWDAGERERLNEIAQLRRAQQPDIHPYIAPFIGRQGGPARLRSMDLWDEANKYREPRRKVLRERWEEFCDVHENRQVTALAAGERRGDIGRLDPLAALARPMAGQLSAGDGQQLPNPDDVV